jgi:hypothetical protein
MNNAEELKKARAAYETAVADAATAYFVADTKVLKAAGTALAHANAKAVKTLIHTYAHVKKASGTVITIPRRS